MPQQQGLVLPPTSAEERQLVQSLCSAPCIVTSQPVIVKRPAGWVGRLPLIKKLTSKWELGLWEDEGKDLSFGELPYVDQLSLGGPSLESLEGFSAPRLRGIAIGYSPRLLSLRLTNPLSEGVSVGLGGIAPTNLEGLGLENLKTLSRFSIGQVFEVSLGALRNITLIESLEISQTSISDLSPLNPQLRVTKFFKAASNQVLTDCQLRELAARTGAPQRQTSITQNQPCP
ncbi:MAG: hypothetical protein IAE78_17655 [Myxococcus sp.]|nr:hypothetical protein [Myxococcus sp.]